MTHQVLQGDSLAVLKTLPSGCAQTCVTSPPYYGLRDYGCDGQIGLEPSPDEFIARLVAVFDEVRRVLADDGTCWVNLGDSYNAKPGQRKTTDKPGNKQSTSTGSIGAPSRSVDGIESKNLIGIPWMFAFAMRKAGWILRQDIIWHKPNPMPESVRDRCTKAHEYLFLFAKQQRYLWDAEAMKENATHANAGKMRPVYGAPAGIVPGGQNQTGRSNGGKDVPTDGKRNKRSVWEVCPKPYKGAHFAVMPPELIRPCVRAGSRPGDTVLDPFGGSGTTAAVAKEEGRSAIIIELNPAYCELSQQRISNAVDKSGLFAGAA
jgi:DNA modification methylase